MSTHLSPSTDAAVSPTPVQRRRDAAETRQRLLDAARRRFATDGYSATTVRDIADDAGVNVALINRYFTSKVGLFQQCLAGSVDEMSEVLPEDVTLDEIADSVAARLAGATDGDRPIQQLLLLFRSSGDEHADQIRRDTLRSYAERIAVVAGWRPGDSDDLLLRAEIVLSATFGIGLLRISSAVQPLAGASEQDLAAPIRDLFSSLMTR